MGRYPRFYEDEGIYVSQAWAVDNLHELAPYAYWYDHPPLGWILLAVWAKLVPTFGASLYSIAAARTFILAILITSAGLLYLVARRLGLRRVFAAFAVLLFGLSPLVVHFQPLAAAIDNPSFTGRTGLVTRCRPKHWHGGNTCGYRPHRRPQRSGRAPLGTGRPRADAHRRRRSDPRGGRLALYARSPHRPSPCGRHRLDRPGRARLQSQADHRVLEVRSRPNQFDYFVRSNANLAGNLYWVPKTKQVLEHRRTVAIFQNHHERIEIRRVMHSRKSSTAWAGGLRARLQVTLVGERARKTRALLVRAQ